MIDIRQLSFLSSQRKDNPWQVVSTNTFLYTIVSIKETGENKRVTMDRERKIMMYKSWAFDFQPLILVYLFLDNKFFFIYT